MIPVFTIGGAIPTAIGALSGLGVLAIARKTGQPTRRKVIYCGVVTGSAWTVFLVFLFALTALQAQHPNLNQARNTKRPPKIQSEPKTASATYSSAQAVTTPQETEMTQEKRLKIYQMAVRMRYHIESAKEQRAKLQPKGFDVTSRDEQIERLKQRELGHFEFVKKFYEFDQELLQEIIAEGNRYNWPTR